jgi:hypothetical protein
MDKKETQLPDYGKKLTAWDFQETPKHERSLLWYIITGVIFLGLVLYSTLSSNFLFTLIIFLGGATFLFSSFKPARKINFEIYQDGIIINNIFTPFTDLKKFWLIYNPPEIKTLYITQNNIFKNELSIPLEQQNPVRIREILLDYLKEDLNQEEENFVDLLRRRMKL